MKIYINYSQFMAIINYLNLNWGTIGKEMFQIHTTVSGSVNQMISLECIVHGFFNIINYLFSIFFKLLDLSNAFYYKTLLVILYPLFLSIILIPILLVLKIKYHFENSVIYERYIIMVAITLNYFLSPVLTALANFINCTDLYSNQYITVFLIERCNDNPQYLFWLLNIILPTFIFYGILLPPCILVYV